MSQEGTDVVKKMLKKIAAKETDLESAAAELDASFGRDCIVMVSDLSGFLGLAKEKGIVCALSMFEKGCEIAEPILKTLGGEVLKAEPDCMVVLFTKAVDAVMAARAVSRAFEEQNSKEADGDQLAICLGIGNGRMLVVGDEVYGEQAALAARLVKAVEGKFEVALTPEAYEAVKHLQSLVFAPAEQIAIGGESVTPYKLLFA